MKDKLRVLIALVFGFAACASAPLRSSAQQTPTTHHHYVVVDAGTLGGPDSIVYEPGVRSLSNRGTLTSCADPPNLDSNNPQSPHFTYPHRVINPYIPHHFH